MAEQHSESDGKISRAQRHLRMGYVSTRHENSKTHMTTYYSRTPGLHLKGDWLREAGFDTGGECYGENIRRMSDHYCRQQRGAGTAGGNLSG